MRRLPVTALLFIATSLMAACGNSDDASDGAGTSRNFVIAQPALTESSGLARSQRESDLYWSHNDSGGPTDLYAFDGRGTPRGVLHLRPALNLDWEDMSSFVEDGAPRLLAADIGDNAAIRPAITLYVLAEPALGDDAPTVNAAPLRTMTVLYPDGPRDCESVAVDASEGMIYLLSKRDAVPKLYRVPLKPTLPLVIAESLGEIVIPRAPDSDPNPERSNWVTSMDFDADLHRAAVVTLTHAYVYTRADAESWADAFQHQPRVLALPDYSQIEAIAWSADGRELLITSEGSPMPAAHLRLD